MMADFLKKNPRILLLVVGVIIAAGLSSFLVLPRLEDPVLGRRVGIVSTVYPGASAGRVESLVTVPLEEKLQGIARIKQVRSNSQTGISNIVIELQDDVYNVQPVWTLVRNRLADAKAGLPQTCFASELQVVPLKAFAAIVALRSKSGNGADLSVLRQKARNLKAEISGIAGTEDVSVFGDPGEEFVAEVSTTKLASTGLSVAAIAEQVKGHIATQPAGRIPSHSGAVMPLHIEDSAPAIERLADARVTYGAQGTVVRLGDIADVSEKPVTPASSIALIDQRPAIVLGAMVSDDLRIDLWAGSFQATIDQFAAQFADVVEVDVLFSQRDHVDQRMESLLKNLGLGTTAVMIVVLFMMGWRSMIVVAAALPLSAMLVLAAMRAMGIPLHQMSVTGLIVALGLLIDNAIVIVEEVRAKIIHGASTSEAIQRGVRHLAMPLFGSTLTTALAFLPIATLPGPPGEFVGTIAVSVILAICASFLLAMTVIPAMSGLLNIDPNARGLFAYGLTLAPIQKLYEHSLHSVLRLPVAGILLGIALPSAGFMAASELPEQFFPPSDRAQIQVEVEQSAQDSLAATKATVREIRGIVAAEAVVDRQHWFIGSSAPTFFYNVVPRRRSTPFYAQAFVDLKSNENIGDLVRRLQDSIDSKIPQSRTIVRQLEQGPPFDAPIEVRVFGPELEMLQELGGQLRMILAETSHVLHTRSDVEETIPRLTLAVDEIAAQDAGLNRSQLAGLLYTTLEGASAGSLLQGDEELPVRIKLRFEGKLMLNQLAALPLPAMSRRPLVRPTGETPPDKLSTSLSSNTLASVTEMRLESDVGAIIRIDGQRTNEVKAYIQAGVLPLTVISEFKRRLAKSDFELPDGYSLQFGGETEQRTQAVEKLIANGVVLFALMLLTLVASFQSFRCALIVASVGGLSIGLGPLALSIFGFPFGFMAIVGTMGLVGVAINDSIVVLAAIRANALAAAGDRTETVKVVMSCSRHIIATTLTTIVGFIPLLIAGGGFWPPLAITIAGGVGGATLLALYFVPACHLLVYRRQITGEIPPAG